MIRKCDNLLSKWKRIMIRDDTLFGLILIAPTLHKMRWKLVEKIDNQYHFVQKTGLVYQSESQ